MKKILFGIILSLCLFSTAKADPTVYFTRDTLGTPTIYYILIDRSNRTKFPHQTIKTEADTYIKQLEVSISSNTTEVKLGYVYEINTSTTNIYWFDRIVRDLPTSTRETVTRYYDPPLRLSVQGKDFALAYVLDTEVNSNSNLQIYDSTTALLSKGDIVVRVVADSVITKLDIKIIYNVQ